MQQIKGLDWSLPSLFKSFRTFQILSLCLLFCPLQPPLTSLHFLFSHFPFLQILCSPFTLPSFLLFSSHHLPFDFMLSTLTPLRRPCPPAEQFSRNMATTLETPPTTSSLPSSHVILFLLNLSSYPSRADEQTKERVEGGWVRLMEW